LDEERRKVQGARHKGTTKQRMTHWMKKGASAFAKASVYVKTSTDKMARRVGICRAGHQMCSV
jgi:hypothetical protein